MRTWGSWLPIAAILTTLCCSIATAAPDRFDNQIPDAVPDPENSYNFSFNYMSVDTDGPVTSERTGHQFLKLGYQFSEKLHASFRFTDHDLAGGVGLTNPIFSNLDSAQSYGLRLEMNLLNEPAVPAGPDNNPAWVAGSAFTIGFNGNLYDLDRSGIGEQETELGAFLSYSTDLTEEMRGHTYFSTSRLTGDNASGSRNRVGAGLDYLLQDGERPLILMANGLIDIYNFRQPQFNTSRISRFDLGLRYKMSRQWDAQVGWSTFNDSEQDSSGGGLFAGINWRSIKDPCHCGECEDCSNMVEPEQPAEGGEQPPSQATADPAMVAAAANLKWDPADTPMMDLSYPARYDRNSVETGLHGTAGEDQGLQRSTASATGSEAGDAGLPTDVQQAEDDGILIPVFPDQQPRMAASADMMVRPRRAAGNQQAEISDAGEMPDDAPEPDDADAESEVSGLQSFVPVATPREAGMQRAPVESILQDSGSDGVADACSRFLFMRIAALPRKLLASR